MPHPKTGSHLRRSPAQVKDGWGAVVVVNPLFVCFGVLWFLAHLTLIENIRNFILKGVFSFYKRDHLENDKCKIQV